MANRYFTGATGGLWSVLTNWDNYSTLNYPGPSDVVFPNGSSKIVYIDTNVIVSEFSNLAAAPIVAGGTFTVDYRCGNVNIVGNLLANSTPTLLQVNLISGQTVNLTGNVGGSSGTYTLTSYGLGVLNIIGNISGGAGTTSYGILCAGNSKVNIVGNISAQGGGTALRVFDNAVVSITGNTFAGSSFSYPIANNNNGIVNFSGSPLNTTAVSPISFHVANIGDGVINVINDQNFTATLFSNIFNNASNGTINFFGNCYGGISGTSGYYLVNNVSTGVVNFYANVFASGRTLSSTLGFINNASTGTINVYGNVRGGISANTIAISNTTTGTINVYGNVSGGTFSGNTPAIYSSTAGFINVYGNCVAGSYPALYSSNTLATNVVGGLVFNTISTPYYAYNLKVTPTASTITTTTTTGNTKIFTTSGYTYGLPFSGDVRSGIRYGSLNEYTGSMVVPLKSSVKLGTLFDTGSTYGEAITNVNDLNVIFSSFTINYTGTT
jgi:hypothetical protein